MIHAFRLGPLPASQPPSYAYAATLPGGKLELQFAAGDAVGLAALREAVKGQPMVCEPALAEAGAAQGQETGPLPPEALELRARLAYELASGVDHGASRPEAIVALLKAAGAFWSSKAWELIAPDEPLHVVFTVGRSVLQGELSLLATDRTQPRLVLCDEPASLARLEGLTGTARVDALVEGAGLTVELAREPDWAGAAIEVPFKLPRVPLPERRRGGRVAPTATQDLVLAAALLQAVVAFTDLGDGTEAEAEVEAAMLHVKARVGPTPLDTAAFESGLTRVRPEGEAAPEPAAPVATAASAEDDAPLSPAELAAILQGGGVSAPATPVAGAAPALPAAASEDDEAPLSPAELAAILQGGAAPAAPAKAPAPPAPPPASTPAPDEIELHPVKLAPPPAPAPPPPRPEPPAPAAPREGWLAKALRAVGQSLHRSPAPAAGPPRPSAAPPARPATKPVARPAAKAAPKPAQAPEPPPDPDGPFAPFARALKLAIPAAPPPMSLADGAAVEALARQIAERAAGTERFVSFPAVALQIIEQVNRPDADARSVAGFISRDPGLAADVLAVANSAAFRGVSAAESVREAVARLGLQEVGRVASAVSARALLVAAQPGGGPPSTRLFTRAVAVATAASATALRVRGAHSDQVWLAGLLHDVGLALGGAAQHGLGAAGGSGALAARALERAHGEIGAAALEAWGLPAYLADVAGRHHDEAPPAGPDQVDLHLVRLTSALSRLAEPEVGARAAGEIVQSARALGFDVHAVRALAADLKAAEQKAGVLVR